MKYIVKKTKSYKKSHKRCQNRGYNMTLLDNIVNDLANGIHILGAHPLKGDYNGFYDVHIEPDWVLIYGYDDNSLILYLMDTGTHSDLY